MTGYLGNLGNFPNAWVSWKFPVPWVLGEISQIARHLENISDTQAFGKNLRYPGIWEISQIPMGI